MDGVLSSIIFISGHSGEEEFKSSLNLIRPKLEVVTGIMQAYSIIRDQAVDLLLINSNTSDVPLEKGVRLLAGLAGRERICILYPEGENKLGMAFREMNPTELRSYIESFTQDKEPLNTEEGQFNLAKLYELSSGDDGFVLEMLDSYDFEQYVDPLRNAIKKTDPTEIGKLCHKIKAPLNMIGFNAMDGELEFMDDVAQGVISYDEDMWERFEKGANNAIEYITLAQRLIREELARLKA